MRYFTLLVLITLILMGCASYDTNPVLPDSQFTSGNFNTDLSEDLSWGYYDLIIETDIPSVSITPIRTASAPPGKWGYHINATKLLEASPCTDCLAVSNVHKLPNGDLSMDVEITHPYKDKRYTGFDVKGIIMFEASQTVYDQEMRIKAGLYPDIVTFRKYWYSTSEKGDPELMNPDGWTMIWAPDYKIGLLPPGDHPFFGLPDSGFPIFEYYEGKYSSELERTGKLNAYRRFYSKEDRHIFEVATTVARTYIIRPPADGGPIKAKYAIYAHWYPPSVVPVNNPLTDFPPEANSAIPYQFYIEQVAPIDPDKDAKGQFGKLRWHVKAWNIPNSHWNAYAHDLMGSTDNSYTVLYYPEWGEDVYSPSNFDIGFYKQLPGAIPGDLTYIFRLEVKHPEDKPFIDGLPMGTDWYITKIYVEDYDGK